MKQIVLKNHSHSVPISVLAVGENGGVTRPEKRDFIYWYHREYLARGGTTIDTARLYGGGESETYIGQFLKTVEREKVTLVTKCAFPDPNDPGFRARLRPEELKHDLETSLTKLDTDYIDVWVVHRDLVSLPVEEVMPTLDSFVRQGKVRVLGASNWTAGRIAEANRFALENGLTPFSVSQIQWSLALTTAAQLREVTSVIMDGAEYAWYRDSGIPVMAWSASAKGFFSKVANGQPLSPVVEQRYGWLEENRRRAMRAKELAGELGVAVGTLVLSYLLSDAVPACAITGFSNIEQFEEAMAAASLTLTDAQRDFLICG